MTQTHAAPVVRFAPSPTGFLHIGGARTALFNYLFAHHHGGQFLLRIEDTDVERSTQEAVDAILNSLQWLDLPWDGSPVFQSKNRERHQQVAHDLYKKGRAYYCQCAPEALQAMREHAMKTGQKPGYNGHCRDKGHTSGALRLLAPDTGSIVINDLVQGTVDVRNDQIDDMVLLRSDGTPTYLLSVVVDDHDMGITHVIRGDDHLTNTFRQYQIYEAMGWDIPEFAHIPLIYGPDGTKLSKRHGAVSVEVYRDMGYLPQALRNYLLRLGWGHGDDEIISDAQAIEWFSLNNIGKSPSRFDFKKLDHVNAHYLRLMDNDTLVDLILPFTGPLSSEKKARVLQGMDGLKIRATTLKELAENAQVYTNDRPLTYTEDAQKLLDDKGRKIMADLVPLITELSDWSTSAIETVVRGYAETSGIKLGHVAQPLRAAITGRAVSPSVFDVMAILGREECLGRLDISHQSSSW